MNREQCMNCLTEEAENGADYCKACAGWHDGVAHERERIARAIRKQFPAYSDEELAAGAAGGGKTVADMIQANVSLAVNAVANSIERGDL